MRLVLADDHPLFRAGIASLLQVWGHEVVGEASNGLEALELVRRLRPDLVLMDITMPECNGLEATRLIKAELPDTRIVIVTVSDHDEDLFEAIKSGAEGYLLKDMGEVELESTLNALEAGEPALSPRLATKILDEFARLSHEAPPREDQRDDLTTREREVFLLLAEGKTPTEVARSLFVSPKTVHTHRQHIMEKLGLRTTTELIRFALRERLIKTV